MIVLDASVVAPALADETADGALARAALRGQALVAPEVIDLEVAGVLRRQAAADLIEVRRAEVALADLRDLPLRRVAHLGMLERCWELRRDVTVYDAAYVALAELLGVVLMTGDERVTRAPGLRCQVRLVR